MIVSSERLAQLRAIAMPVSRKRRTVMNLDGEELIALIDMIEAKDVKCPVCSVPSGTMPFPNSER